MAHPLPPSVPEIPGASQPKTLFLPAPGHHGMIVDCSTGRRRTTGHKFRDAHEALTWCEQHHVAFVYWFQEDPSQN